jgi:hypothetical protein
VTNNLDSGAGSLRDAIKNANSGDTIALASSLNGQTIILTSGELAVSQSLDLDRLRLGEPDPAPIPSPCVAAIKGSCSVYASWHWQRPCEPSKNSAPLMARGVGNYPDAVSAAFRDGEPKAEATAPRRIPG